MATIRRGRILQTDKNLKEGDTFIRIAPEISLFYVVNPKCASLTLRSYTSFLNRKFGRTFSPFRGTISVQHERLLGGRGEGDADDFWMTFVRNPYTRILSAYLDKFVQDHRGQFLKYAEQARALNKNHASEKRITFEDFVNLVSRQRPEDMNRHWRPQVLTIRMDRIKYDFIGRVEKFDEDVGVFLGSLKAELGIDPSSLSHSFHKTDARSKIRKYFSNPALVQQVYEIYREDFETFGYSPDIEEVEIFHHRKIDLPRRVFQPKNASLSTQVFILKYGLSRLKVWKYTRMVKRNFKNGLSRLKVWKCTRMVGRNFKRGIRFFRKLLR